MRAPQIPFLTAKTLNTEGFEGRWPPLDRLVGVLTVFHMGMLFVHTLPWDGAVNGRVETIIRCTKNYNGQLVRNFLRDYRSRYCVVSECLRRGQPKAPIPQTPFVLWVRYRNNIDICLANPSPVLRNVLRVAISATLHELYGIRLKWEPHGTTYVWGEGSLAPSGAKVTLIRKGSGGWIFLPPTHAWCGAANSLLYCRSVCNRVYLDWRTDIM